MPALPTTTGNEEIYSHSKAQESYSVHGMATPGISASHSIFPSSSVFMSTEAETSPVSSSVCSVKIPKELDVEQ